MISFTTMGMFLFTIPFAVIALHSLKEHLKDKENLRKKHISYAFLFVSIGFVLDLIAVLMISNNMSPGELTVVKILSKVFDCFTIIGVFWSFVFLTDFLEGMKKYIPFVIVHLVITLIILIVMPLEVNMINGELMEERIVISSLAILFFWFLYWSIFAYKFWEVSGLTTNKVATRRSQMMSLGGVFSILAYVSTIFACTYQILVINFAGEIFAGIAGIIFYLGFIAPQWLRRRWEK